MLGTKSAGELCFSPDSNPVKKCDKLTPEIYTFTVRHSVHPRAQIDEGVNCPVYGIEHVNLREGNTVSWPCERRMSIFTLDIHLRSVLRKP